mmetsp:Transcript_115229/g.366280  ORF Transcript_115229/g.366280 Transcript_115229/m.366280 type:complete len:309 (-) Transcript_115229:19-945(-)
MSEALPSHVLRVNQLDARRLDDEIGTMLRQQLADVTLYSSGFCDRFQPEMDALLRGVLWRYSVWVDSPTPGGQMQNVVYSRAAHRGLLQKPLLRRQKLAFLLLNVAWPWLLIRLTGLAQTLQEGFATGEGGWLGALARRSWAPSVARWYLHSFEPRATRLPAVCSALNFLLFLRSGVFSTLGDRLLGIRLVHIDPSAHRQLPMQYMNRVMIWNGLSEFLMTVTPLINLGRLRQTITRRLFPKAMLRSMDEGAVGTCGFCGVSPMTLPVVSDCGHHFCYFCLGSEQMKDPHNVACPRCSERIQSFGYAS